MVTLPDPNSLPHFLWVDATGQLQPLRREVRQITDYVIDSNDWPSKKSTVRSVLTRNRFDLKCEVCHQKRDTCRGKPCVEYFQKVIAVAGKSMCDIKNAGHMGLGVFANEAIRNGTILGEYLGRLYPVGDPKASDPYVFLFNEIAECSALGYGNFTRFVNHHCRPNVAVRLAMYGRRQVIMYEANREIAVGEQLYVDYGTRYFYLPGNPCRCDAVEGDHVPGKSVPKVTTRSKAKVGASASSARTRSQKLDALSKGAQRNSGSGVPGRPSKPARNSAAISSVKRKQEHSAAVLKGLTRSAGVCSRYGPQVYTSYLRWS